MNRSTLTMLGPAIEASLAIAFIMLIVIILFGVGGCGGGGNISDYVDFAVCYVHPEYGKVCVEFDGKLRFRADVQNDPLKLAEVTDWLKSKGVKIPESQ